MISNDLKAAKKMILNSENQNFKIIFPGEGEVSSPGKQKLSQASYVNIKKVEFDMHIYIRNNFFTLIVGTDLALLSFADHSILTYGTFGMWGALLAKGGHVTMPKGYSKHKATYNIEIAKMKNWVFI